MGPGQDLVSSMPGWLLYPVTLIALAIITIVLVRAKSVAGRFALFALFFRYIANAHHAIAFKASPLGLSWNALGSSGVFVIGLLFIRARHLLLWQMVPLYLLIGVVILSGLANHDPQGIIDVVVKLGYFGVITLAVYEGLDEIGERRMMTLLLWAFLAPFIFQAASIVLGVVKASESDGSVSYIGGYSHEAAFSIVLMTCFVIACFATGLRPFLRFLLLVTCLGAIFLANYRTAIVALAPLAIVQFNADVITRFSHRQRIVIGVFLLAVSVPVVLGLAWLMRERFADIGIVLADVGNLIKPPEQYTFDEARLLSGRAYLWSEYVTAYLKGDTLNHLLGFGPNAWMDAFTVYAHNTLISTVYEYGIAGVVAMLYLWGAMLWIACRIRSGPRAKVVAAHLGFLLLNMATMPHWMLEGDILYGVICGYTFHLFLRRAPVAAAEQPETVASPDGSPTKPAVAVGVRAGAAAPGIGRREVAAIPAHLRGMVAPTIGKPRD